MVGLKTTKVQDIRTQNVISIANRNIEQIEVVSDMIYIELPLPYEVKVGKAEEALNEIVTEIKNNENVEDCEYKGVNELADSSINYLIAVKCDVNKKLQTRRDAIRTALLVLDKHGIEVPFTQIDIHNK